MTRWTGGAYEGREAEEGGYPTKTEPGATTTTTGAYGTGYGATGGYTPTRGPTAAPSMEQPGYQEPTGYGAQPIVTV